MIDNSPQIKGASRPHPLDDLKAMDVTDSQTEKPDPMCEECNGTGRFLAKKRDVDGRFFSEWGYAQCDCTVSSDV